MNNLGETIERVDDNHIAVYYPHKEGYKGTLYIARSEFKSKYEPPHKRFFNIMIESLDRNREKASKNVRKKLDKLAKLEKRHAG